MVHWYWDGIVKALCAWICRRRAIVVLSEGKRPIWGRSHRGGTATETDTIFTTTWAAAIVAAATGAEGRSVQAWVLPAS